jgi:RNA polymerase sigma-70 factor (ECF subfamily)
VVIWQPSVALNLRFRARIGASYSKGERTDVTSEDVNSVDGSGGRDSASTSTSLVERVKARDPRAWEHLVDLYGPLVYRYCRQMGLPSQDAPDVMQEVFRSVFAGLDSFRGDHKGSFRAWLRGITRHRVLDQLRRDKGVPEVAGGTAAQQRFQEIPEEGDPTTTGVLVDPANSLWHRALELVKGEFELATWQAFWRVAVDGEVPADVAEDLAMSRHAVYKAKSRVMRRLRQVLNGLEGDA